MKSKIAYILAITMLLTTLIACNEADQYSKYIYTFYDVFDTVIQVVAYAKNEEEFNTYMKDLEERFTELHRLYDRYHNYEGINNIRTINDNAGIKPVKVDKEIIDLIVFCKEQHERVGNLTNIAIGRVTDIWSYYREEGINDPEKAELPPMELLEQASKHTDMDKIIVNEDEGTVYLDDPDMLLDVGAVAKGFATEIVAREMEEKGLKSALISAGGNIRGIGKPLDGVRGKWGVGIQNPDASLFDVGNVLETVFINDLSIVSSGDYQRYYYVGDTLTIIDR